MFKSKSEKEIRKTENVRTKSIKKSIALLFNCIKQVTFFSLNFVLHLCMRIAFVLNINESKPKYITSNRNNYETYPSVV